MTSEVEKDLAERVRLIENMMAEGRRKTESWGWTFVLWGVAYYVATAWATWGRSFSGLAGNYDRCGGDHGGCRIADVAWPAGNDSWTGA